MLLPNILYLEQLLGVELKPLFAECRMTHTVFGQVVTHQSFNVLYDANFCLVTQQPAGTHLTDLVAETDPIFRRAAVSHRRFLIYDRELVRTLGSELITAGYDHSRLVMMARQNPARVERSPRVTLRPVLGAQGEGLLDRIEAELVAETPWSSHVIKAMLQGRRREVTSGLPLRWFWASVDGELAGSIGLLREGAVASIQGVCTRPDFRNQGVATSMVLEMVALAQSLGHPMISLLTEERDGPLELYGRIGFEAVGYLESYLRET